MQMTSRTDMRRKLLAQTGNIYKMCTQYLNKLLEEVTRAVLAV
jgi:hypothetical protein